MHYNLTLLFSFTQAVSCAEAEVTDLAILRPHFRLVQREGGGVEMLPAGTPEMGPSPASTTSDLAMRLR